VRHVPAGGVWHPATDQLAGTDVYGTPADSLNAPAWSKKFDDIDFDEFLFASGDETKWLISSKDAVIGGFYAGVECDIIKSSMSGASSRARWYRRQGCKEDPWISLTDHHSAVQSNDILYGGNSYMHRTAWIKDHGGANVFIRKTAKDLPRLGLGKNGSAMPGLPGLFGSVKVSSKEQPGDRPAGSGSKAASAPFLEIVFDVNGKDKRIKIFHRPLGAEFSKPPSEPVKVCKVQSRSYASELGMEAGWVVKTVAGEDVGTKTFQQIQDSIKTGLIQLPEAKTGLIQL